jgi:hypothetical protein
MIHVLESGLCGAYYGKCKDCDCKVRVTTDHEFITHPDYEADFNKYVNCPECGHEMSVSYSVHNPFKQE